MILLNFDSDCSILDSSIPPKGITQKQWEKNNQDTIKFIEKKNQNNSISRSKNSPKQKLNRNKSQLSSDEFFFNTDDKNSNSLSQNSIDEQVKTPIKTKSKDVQINQSNEKQIKNNKKSLQNQAKDKKASQRNNQINHVKIIKRERSKKLASQELQDSSSIGIDEFQKDLWFKKSMKSIGDFEIKENDFTSSTDHDNYVSNSDNSSCKHPQKQVKGNKESSIISASLKNSEKQSIMDMQSGDENNSEISNENEIVHIGHNRSGKISIIRSDSNNNIDNDNNDSYHSNDDSNNINTNDTNICNNENNGDLNSNNKRPIKWEIKVFDNIFDIDYTNSPKRRLKSKKHSKNSHDKNVKQTHLDSKGSISEKVIESEVGQLDLPSSAPIEIHPNLGSSDMEIELRFFQSEEFVQSPQQSYNSPYKDSPNKNSSLTSSKSIKMRTRNTNEFDDEADQKRKKHRLGVDISSSEAQGDFLVQFQKNAKLLSSESNLEEEKPKDKVATRQGIALFMLSSSEAEEQEVKKSPSAPNSAKLNQPSSMLDQNSSLVNASSVNDSEAKNKTETESENLNSEVDSLNDNKAKSHFIASLTIVQAHGLPMLNVPRKDPYCLVRLKGSHDPMRTKVMRDTTSPIWNSKFSFDIDSIDDPLLFSVRYEDKFGGDIDAAFGELSLKNIEVDKYFETWIRLHPISSNSYSTEESTYSSITSACELYVTLILESKKESKRRKKSRSRPASPKTFQNQLKESSSLLSNGSGSDLVSSSLVSNASGSGLLPASSPTSLKSFSNYERYDGELAMTITIVEAKDVWSNFNGLYCTVNVVGRKDVRKTKTVFGTTSPIWDQQFNFTLANSKDTVTFSIRVEDKARGDFAIARVTIGVDQIPLNSFANKWVTLRAVKEIKRLPIKNPSLKKSNKIEGENCEESEDSLLPFIKDNEATNNVYINNNTEPPGKLHFTLVLEPKIRDEQFSPRNLPSPIDNGFAGEFGYPESPMSHYIWKQS